jgi:hypothetical protein
MAIVAKGLGQPESGSVVAAGMGAAGEPSGFLSVRLDVTSTSEVTIAAEVLGTELQETPSGGGGKVIDIWRYRRPVVNDDDEVLILIAL